ncbi:6-phospho-3-hexuloisomerase [Paenibacillus maysiensis]|uniref:6-phospho-3-hexuloisomerase n=1 Tax=Paenibacillus maysiensis TaxID=1155954 RepID=UPI0004712B6D|nr:6-phospho-3-hexuloisomerase [Paenibacillus maysiensis]
MNKIKENLDIIMSELKENNSRNNEIKLDTLLEDLLKSKKIFLCGAGRSQLMIRAFAMRLMQLGLNAYVVGDTTTPHSTPGDLLVIASGSGETSCLISIANSAKRNNLKLALFTTNINSKLANLADYSINISAPNKSLDDKSVSFQPLGTLFEQKSLLMYDVIVIELMNLLNVGSQYMSQNHADLE